MARTTRSNIEMGAISARRYDMLRERNRHTSKNDEKVPVSPHPSPVLKNDTTRANPSSKRHSPPAASAFVNKVCIHRRDGINAPSGKRQNPGSAAATAAAQPPRAPPPISPRDLTRHKSRHRKDVGLYPRLCTSADSWKQGFSTLDPPPRLLLLHDSLGYDIPDTQLATAAPISYASPAQHPPSTRVSTPEPTQDRETNVD